MTIKFQKNYNAKLSEVLPVSRPPAFLIVLTALLLSMSTPLLAGVEAYDLVNKMSHSYRELDYQGVFSFQQGDDLHSLKVSHAVYDGEEFERLEHLDGEKEDIVRRGHDLNCIHPGHQLVRMLSQQNKLSDPVNNETITDAKPIKITEFYQFMLVGKNRVAGREVVEVLLSPKDKHRFSHHLSLDKETGLLLKSVLVGLDDEVLEQFQFVDIVFGKKVTKSYFETNGQVHDVAHLDSGLNHQDSLSLNSKRWAVNWVPDGYMPVVASNDMATFSDGLSAFSVFLETIDRNAYTKEGQSQRGATIAYSKPLRLVGRLHRVTVVGEIPRQTAKLVAKSVNLLTPPNINKQ